MAEKTTFIKLDRNILQWQWYKDHNTKEVFIHLLLKANIKSHGFMGVTIGRGELATSINSLAAETGLSLKNVRTALKHLEATGEVAIRRHSRFSVISILSYNRYQDKRQRNGQSSGNQVATIKECKKDINIQEERVVSPSLEDVISYKSEAGLTVDAQAFWDYYEGTGWMRGNQPIKNWKAVMRGWEGKPVYKQNNRNRQDEIDEATRRWLEK